MGKTAPRAASIRLRGPAAALILALTVAAPATAEARAVRVGLFPAAPLVFELDGKPAGLFVDVLEHCAREFGWTILYVRDTWSALLAKLEAGSIDLLPAVGVTVERQRIFDFTRRPVYVDSGVVFTGRDFSPRTVFDLRGRRVAAVAGSVFTGGFADYVASFGIECELVYKPDNPSVMAAVSSGETDAGVCIYSLGTELAKRYPVRISAISFSPLALAFATGGGRNADLIAGVDSLMDSMVDDPDSAYNVSFRKWAMPAERAAAPRWMVTGGLGLLALGLFLAAWAMLLRRQVSARTRALRLEVAERDRVERELVRSLSEKSELLRELYHRTKNTMQLIQSMMELQAADYPGNEGIVRLIQDTSERIQAIALVHHMLYGAQDLSSISGAVYLEELARQVCRAFPQAGRVDVRTSADEGAFAIDTIIPVGLIVNELLTNSLKHAFPGGRAGAVRIALESNGDECALLYGDDGVGMAEGYDFSDPSTLGLKLVRTLGEGQLKGDVRFGAGPGFSCAIRFARPYAGVGPGPDPAPMPR